MSTAGKKVYVLTTVCHDEDWNDMLVSIYGSIEKLREEAEEAENKTLVEELLAALRDVDGVKTQFAFAEDEAFKATLSCRTV